MSPRSSIAHYRVTEKIGEGGMGEVWRATDTKLNRDVAIKILPERLAQDADRMARFAREAQILASMNHPGIAAIHGVEDRALIMELAEGPTLAERLAVGAMPVDEALGIARQIAEALEYAHERGVVHRDLKPANIKVGGDGRVKVLDFGLAKAIGSEMGAGDPASSPTLTIRATMAGVILGTAAYMSPEQARGHVADKRSDIWSFGVVLYEMLTGRRLFEAATVSDTLAGVLRADPDWSALPAGLPANVRTMLRRCLERDPKRRLRDIGDARLELEQAAAEPVAAQASPVTRALGWLPWLVTAVVTLAAAAVAILYFRESAAAAPVVRFNVPPPEKGGFNAWLGLSPDGRYLGFTATDASGVARVWVRPLDSLEARPLAGSEGSVTFFWSPDSRYVVFQSTGKLKKMAISGGPAQTLCEGVGVLLGGSWNADGAVLFGGSNGPIMRVSSAGGIASPVTRLERDRGEINHTDPIFLPDGRHFLYLRRSLFPENAGIYAGSLDIAPEHQSLKPVRASDFSAAYAPPRAGLPGRLLFLQEDSLFAQSFDDRRLELIGEPAPIAEQVGTSITRGFFAVSTNGVLAYRSGSSISTQFTWRDREGRVLGHAGNPGPYDDLTLARDASTVAYTRPTPGAGNRQIWVFNAARGSHGRLTFLPDGARSPVWSPDGESVAFSAVRGPGIYMKSASNSGAEELLFQSGATAKYLNDWSRDGRFLLYAETARSLDLWALSDVSGGGERKAFPVANTGFNETQGRFSPDSRWVAYASDDSGRYEIYVIPFPPGEGRAGKSLVSSAGGQQPRWRGDGKELFYVEPDQRLMAVDVKTGPVYEFSTPHPLFATPATVASNVMSKFDVTQDGKRFLMVDVVAGGASAPATVVLNWDAALKK